MIASILERARGWARSLTGQIVLLLCAALLAAQIFNLFLLIDQRRLAERAGFERAAIERFVAAAQEADRAVAAGERLPLALRHPRTRFGLVFFSRSSLAAARPGAAPAPELAARLRSALEEAGFPSDGAAAARGPVGGPPFAPDDRIFLLAPDGAVRPAPVRGPRGHGAPGGPPPPPDATEMTLSYPVAPDLWLNALAAQPPADALPLRIALATAGMFAFALAAATFFAGRIARPLRALSAAADGLGRGEAGPPLPVAGPDEARRAAAAFNAMRERITRLLDTQAFMLRSVGHDLRTPLTALRLRAEGLEDPAERAKFVAAIEEMQDLTEEILAWTKDTASTEPAAPVDLEALLSSLVDDYADQGAPVRLGAAAPAVYPCRRGALRRAIRNLVDNALAYGGEAELTLALEDGAPRIEIADRGPGLPAAALETVFQPFRRMEASRSRDTGGAGLGLSIARTIAENHGGRLTLQNRRGGGLIALLTLPPA